MKEINYYEILEITENASSEVIKAAYKALVKKYHPDTGANNDDFQKNMADINEAYEILSNEKKRLEYDLKRKAYQNTDNDVDQQCNSTGRKESNPDNTSENTEKSSEENDGVLKKILKGIGKEIVRNIQTNNQELENAYLEGLSLETYALIKKFKFSKGYKRAGYIKALEQKKLLERDCDGRLIPSYEFRQWF